MKYPRFLSRAFVLSISLFVLVAVSYAPAMSTRAHADWTNFFSVYSSTFTNGTIDLPGGDLDCHAATDGDTAAVNSCKLACNGQGYSQCALEIHYYTCDDITGSGPTGESSSCSAVPGSAGHKYAAPPYASQSRNGTATNYYDHYAIYEPVSTTLIASPSSITTGGSATLTWTSIDAASCSINNGIGNVSISGTSNGGSMSVKPTTTTTYTITCTGGGTGNQTATASDTVTVGSGGGGTTPTAAITVSPGSIASGGATTVGWTCTNATFARITNNNNPNIGPIKPYQASGSVSDSPTVSGTYTLECADNAGHTASDSKNITVGAPAIGGTCSVYPTSAKTGDTVTWNSYPTGGTGSYTYSWTGTDGLSATTKNVSTTYASAGAKSASVTITSGGKSKTIACSNTVTVTAQLPDLTVDSVVATPASPISIGTNVALTANVTNGGSAAAGGFPNAFQIQDSSGVSTYVPASNNNMSEGVGVSKAMNGSYTFASADTYKIRACANTNASGSNPGTNVITESDYGNNCSGTWTTFVVKAPNLTAGNISPTAYVAGQSSIISATVNNTGNTGSGTFTNKFQRATDASGTGQQSLGTDAMGNVAASGSGTTQLTYTFSSADATSSPFYVRVCADSNNDVGESNETDNCGNWVRITVLDTTCSVSPTSANTGDTVTWSAVPVGGAGSYTYSWGGTDGLTGSTKNVSTTYSSTGAKSANVTVTSGGVSVYKLCSNTVSIGTAAAPNLTAGSITPTTAVLGVSTAFSATVSNIGNAPTGAGFRSVFQTATDGSGTGATGISTYTTGSSLAANGTVVVTVNYTPASMNTFWGRFCADSGSQIAESIESDNCGPWTQISVQAPDITAGDTTAGTAIKNSSTTLTSTISNAGNVTANNIPSVFQIKNPQNYIVTNVISVLGPGVTKAITATYTFPTAQNYQVRACGNMDSTGTIVLSESDYSNNCGPYVTVSVGTPPAPDLTAGGITPTTATAGTALTLTGTVTNGGDATTGAGFTNLFQKATDSSGTGATDIGTDSMGTLNAGIGAQSTLSYTFTTAGNWYVRLCADKSSSGSAGVIDESVENNNCGSWTQVTVAAPAAPTCSLSSPTNPASPNQVVTINWVSTGATSCTETSNPDGFTTGGARTGSDATVNPPSLPRSYGATCTGAGGTTTCTPVTITNVCGNNPTLTITASPNRVKQGGSSVISWTGSGVPDSSCTISGPGLTTVTATANSCNLTPDNRTVTNITKQSTYTITCGTVSQSVIVNVIPKLIEF